MRQLQRQLWAVAKRAPGRRFHALYGQMCRGDVPHEAWKRVRRNKGAAGVDRLTIGEIEQYGVRRFLEELGEVLRAGAYGAQVVRRPTFQRQMGRSDPGHPDGADRVVQMAAKLVLEPICEADFGPCSYGFRPKRSAQMALQRLRQLGKPRRGSRAGRRHRELLRQHRARKPLTLVGQRVSDRKMPGLVRQWLQAGVMEDGW
ncbi:MAG: hypothetical protein IPH51_18400 [Rubrivivax sp.]|nr:hypothetical protein [Rubrivivax sp.]